MKRMNIEPDAARALLEKVAELAETRCKNPQDRKEREVAGRIAATVMAQSLIPRNGRNQDFYGDASRAVLGAMIIVAMLEKDKAVAAFIDHAAGPDRFIAATEELTKREHLREPDGYRILKGLATNRRDMVWENTRIAVEMMTAMDVEVAAAGV